MKKAHWTTYMIFIGFSSIIALGVFAELIVRSFCVGWMGSSKFIGRK